MAVALSPQSLRSLHVLDAVSPSVSVSCLGPFRLAVGGVQVDGWRPSKARSLFQYLVNHRDRPVPRETLIEVLWPESDAFAIGSSLKVAIHTLRKALAEALSGDAGVSVVAHDCGYQLNTSGLMLDVEQFERAYTEGRRAEVRGERAAALGHYAHAADLYGGDFLPDSWDDWVLFRRERLRDQYLLAVTRLADAAFSAGDYEACLGFCQQLLAQDRCREDTYRVLMICHARLGQPARARTWYDLCVRALKAELDSTPEPATDEIYRQVLDGTYRSSTPVSGRQVALAAS